MHYKDKPPYSFSYSPKVKNKWVLGLYANIVLKLVFLLVSGRYLEPILYDSYDTAFYAACYGTLLASKNDLYAHFKLRRWIFVFGLGTFFNVNYNIVENLIDIEALMESFSLFDPSTLILCLYVASLLWTSVYTFKYYKELREYAIRIKLDKPKKVGILKKLYMSISSKVKRKAL